MTSQTIALTLSPKYAAHWGLWEAVRELLQNAYDQADGDPDCEVEFDYKDGEVRVATSTGRLPLTSLLLGETTKKGGTQTRGKFGEGYKLALLVLHRLGHEPVVRMVGETWIPFVEFDATFGSDLFKIRIEADDESKLDQPGVTFVIKSITPEQWVDLRTNVCETYGILHEESEKGRIYVGKLFVTKMAELTRGYSFRVGEVELDRDRGMVRSFDVKYATSRMWERENRVEVVDMVDKGVADVEYLTHHTRSNSPVVQLALKKFMGEAGEDTVPVSSQDEIERAQAAGIKWKLVPTALLTILKQAKTWFIPSSELPAVRLEKFIKKYRYHLPQEAIQELSDIAQALTR